MINKDPQQCILMARSAATPLQSLQHYVGILEYTAEHLAGYVDSIDLNSDMASDQVLSAILTMEAMFTGLPTIMQYLEVASDNLEDDSKKKMYADSIKENIDKLAVIQAFKEQLMDLFPSLGKPIESMH